MKPLTPTSRRRLLEETVATLARVLELEAQALDLMAVSQNGHPRAARYDRDQVRPSRLWCFTHQRDHHHCQTLGETCGGTPVTVTDPTGDAATTADPAAATLRLVDRRIATLNRFADALLRDVVAWSPPTTDRLEPRDTAAPTAPPGWCTSCWRDDRTHVEVTCRPDGQPYYADLCRFCGSFRREYAQLPPLKILKAHHQGRRITGTLLARHLPTVQRRRAG